MDSFMQLDIFFFIASIGFVVLGLLGVIALLYVIKVIRSFKRILVRIETSMDTIGDATLELVETLRAHPLVRFLLPAIKHMKTKRKKAASRSVEK